MVRHKHGRRPFKPYSDALTRANDDERAPQPLCIGRSAEFVDYPVGSHPDEETAAAMCAGCPLLEVCNLNARQQLPEHGVWGGIAWVDRRQAHLMAPDAEVIELRVVPDQAVELPALEAA